MLAWVIVVSTVRRVPVALFGFDQIVSTWTLYLAVTLAARTIDATYTIAVNAR